MHLCTCAAYKIITVSRSVVSREQMCAFLIPAFAKRFPSNLRHSRCFGGNRPAFKQFACRLIQQSQQFFQYVWLFIITAQIKPQKRGMAIPIQCVALKELNRSNGFPHRLVYDTPSHEIPAVIGKEPELYRLHHLFFGLIMKVIPMAVIAVEQWRRLRIAVYFQKISAIFLLDKTKQKAFAFQNRTFLINIHNMRLQTISSIAPLL